MAPRSAVGYGRGTASISEEELDRLALVDPVEELRRVFSAADYQPPTLPSVAVEIHGLTRDPDVSFDSIVELLERDVMLAADVLRVAQSPAYARRVPARSLRDAVSRLGLARVRDIVWTLAMRGRVFRAPGYERVMSSLVRHCTATAHLSKIVSSRTAISEEYAFLCGLLHDVGLVACLLAVSERSARKAGPPIAELAPTLLAVHEEAGEVLTRLWELPMDVRLVVAHHHDPRIDGFCHPLAAVVCVAQTLAIRLGEGTGLGPDLDLVDDFTVGLACEAIGLDARAVDAIIDEARERVLPSL